MSNQNSSIVGERMADKDILDMLQPLYTKIFSDTDSLKEFCDFWSSTDMEYYSSQNRLYFMKQTEERGEQLRYFASKSRLNTSYYMDIKPSCIDEPYEVLMPITLGDKYGIDKIYKEVLDVLSSKDKEAVYKIESAGLYFFKEKENHISVYNAKNKVYLLRNIPSDQILDSLKAIKDVAAEWRIQNVYNIEQCIPQKKQAGGEHPDRRAIIYHEQVPGALENKSEDKLQILATSIKEYAIKNNLQYDSEEKNVEKLISSVLCAKMGDRTSFEKEIVEYVALRQFGFNPEFKIEIPLEYQRDTLSTYEKRNVLDDLNNVYKNFKKDIEKSLKERDVDIQLNSVKDYQEGKLTQAELSRKASFYRDRITKKEYIIGYAANIINSDSIKSKEEVNELVENVSVLAIYSQKLKDMAATLEDKSASQNIKEQVYASGARIIDKLALYENKLQKSINTYLISKEHSMEQEHDAREKNFADRFREKPYLTLLELQENGEEKLQGITRNELAYIARSTYLKSNYAKYLKQGKDKFIEKAIARLEKIEDVVSKHGVFVEVNFSENVLKEQMFYSGEICGIKDFNKKVVTYEKIIQKEKQKYEKEGKSFPASECRVTVFAPTIEKSKENAAYFKINDTKLMEVEFTFEIGSGEYQSFKDVIVQGVKELTSQPDFNGYKRLENFLTSIDKSFKERISVKKAEKDEFKHEVQSEKNHNIKEHEEEHEEEHDR